MNWIKHNALAMVFVGLIGFGVAYTIEHDPNSGYNKLRDALILQCEKGLGKSQLFIQFAEDAAAARRASAAAEAAAREKVRAANDLNTAKRYELLAKQYDNLTVKDCNKAYPEP